MQCPLRSSARALASFGLLAALVVGAVPAGATEDSPAPAGESGHDPAPVEALESGSAAGDARASGTAPAGARKEARAARARRAGIPAASVPAPGARQSRKASSLDEVDGEELERRGRQALEAEDTQRAVDLLEAAIAAEPGQATHHYWLAMASAEHVHRVGALQKLGVAKRLLAALDETVRLDPAHVGARLALMDFHRLAPSFAGGDAAALKRHREALLRLNPIEGRVALARRALELGEHRDAERWLRQALAEQPERREIRLLLARLQEELGREDEARALLRSLLLLNPRDGEAATELARLQGG